MSENLVDVFESTFGAIAHANEEINEIHKRINDFFGTQPYRRLVDIDKATNTEIHKIKLTSKLPRSLANIAKDAAGNLRDALDYAVYAATQMIKDQKDPSDTGFPFGRDKRNVVDRLQKGLRGTPKELHPILIDEIKPFQDGNLTLYQLNQLRNPNTHRFLVPVGVGQARVNHDISGSLVAPIQLGYSRWDPAAQEIEYMRVGVGSKYSYSIEFKFAVVFGDIEAVKGRDVVHTLRHMSVEVERVCNIIKNAATETKNAA